jgi:hypothetical protein
MDKNEIKKDLYKSKVNAKFAYYCHGSLYYNVETLGGVYQFPIETTQPRQIMVGGFDEMDGPADGEYIDAIRLSSDLGTTPFNAEIKASDLNRWIAKAIDKGEFIKIG